MRYNFVKFGITANLELNEERKDYPFFEQNREKFSQVFDFLSGQNECFIMTGLQGVGKSKILDEALSYLNSDVLLFRYQMYKATTLDDILFNFILDFREYQKNLQIQLPKIDSRDFREKIQAYIKAINKPMLLVLESYESIFESEENANLINDFLLHIASIDKFKIIFVSRTFNPQIFEDKNILFDKTIITSLEENLVTKYFDKYEIAYNQENMEKLISSSRCYLKYIDMTIKLIQTFNLSLNDLMNEFELKNINFSSFLIGKFLSLIPEKSRELVYILTLIRQGVSQSFLSFINKNNSTEINYLKNILIFNDDTKNNIYIKDYFKKEIEKEIEQFETIKIHSFLEKFYDNMLPKKPLVRELPISRNTMRREKEYHASFVQSYQASGMKSEHSVSTNLPKIEDVKKETIEEKEEEKITIINIQSDKTIRRKEPKIIANTYESCLNTAKKYEKEFDYSSAIFYYQKASEYNVDESIKPNLLIKIAKCYLKLDNFEESIKYFNLAYERYLVQNKKIEANEVLYEISLEYKNNYKFYPAKSSLEKIIDTENNNYELLTKSYNLLADIEDLSGNISTAKTLYKKALENAEKTNDKALLSTAYFKYGLLLDDTHQQTQAIDYYKKCIETSTNPQENQYLSAAYSNLAGISYERGSLATALNYYHKALDVDKITHNNEGLYFVYTKLSSLYEKDDKQVSYKYLLTALQIAKRLNDKFYITCAYLEIGDYYYRQNASNQAIKAYLSAKHFVENDVENKIKIDTRLKDLKIKLGEQKYTLAIEGFKYNDEN